MNPIIIEKLNKKFNNQFLIETDEDGSFIKFPAKSHDFGDVFIREESAGTYIVVLGKFTHEHFDYNGTEDEMIKKAADDISCFLETLFKNGIICWGTHEGGGGWTYKFFDDEDDVFDWSGLFKKANSTE